MIGKAVLLGLLLICVATDAAVVPQGMREPSCPSMDKIVACPKIFAPVCGSDGNTYANECSLCVQSQIIKMVILVAKEGKC